MHDQGPQVGVSLTPCLCPCRNATVKWQWNASSLGWPTKPQYLDWHDKHALFKEREYPKTCSLQNTLVTGFLALVGVSNWSSIQVFHGIYSPDIRLPSSFNANG